MKKIGIVSGLGAAAGAHLYTQLVKACQKKGAKRDCDFPEVFLHGIQSEGLDKHGISDFDTLRMELLDSIARLNGCGADVIIIACNTAHIFLKELQEASRAKILNMIEIASTGTGEGPVGIISSATTRFEGIYEKTLSKQKVPCLHVYDYQQVILDSIIERVISGQNEVWDQEEVFSIIESLKDRGATKVILGCTELPLVFINRFPGDFCIDPGQKTVERAIS